MTEEEERAVFQRAQEDAKALFAFRTACSAEGFAPAEVLHLTVERMRAIMFMRGMP